MQVREFMEKMFSARLEQTVVVNDPTYGSGNGEVTGISFDNENVIIEVKWTE